MINAFPLDMVQYKRLFGTTRIPQMEKDELITYTDSRHIIVMRNDHLYKIDVVEPDGKMEEHIYCCSLSSLPLSQVHQLTLITFMPY